MNKGLTILLVGGGAAWIAYQFGWLCGFGFGPSCAPAPAAGGTSPTAPPAPASAPPMPPTTTPAAPAPGTVGFSLVGPVAPDANNSIKGQVSIAGQTQALNCIPPGDIWNGNTDITSTLVAQGVDVNGLCSAMQAALLAQQQAAGTTSATAGTSTAPTADQLKAQIASLQTQLAGAPPNLQIALQTQLQNAVFQLAKISQAPGMLGYTRGMGARMPGRLPMPINYVRVARRYR
jgi:hypothetical protein